MAYTAEAHLKFGKRDGPLFLKHHALLLLLSLLLQVTIRLLFIFELPHPLITHNLLRLDAFLHLVKIKSQLVLRELPVPPQHRLKKALLTFVSVPALDANHTEQGLLSILLIELLQPAETFSFLLL